MRAALRVALLALAFAVGTVGLGWWTVPVLGVAWGVVARAHGRAALTAALAAGTAWLLLLGWAAVQGPVGSLATKVGGVMGLPGTVLLAITPAYAMIVVGSGAYVAAAVLRTIRPTDRDMLKRA